MKQQLATFLNNRGAGMERIYSNQKNQPKKPVLLNIDKVILRT